MTPRAPRPPSRPVGTVTRGTTNPNRLRRMDRWIAATHGAALRRADEPVAVDLGYGAAPWTAVELLLRLRTAAPRARVVGIEKSARQLDEARRQARDEGDQPLFDERAFSFSLLKNPFPGEPIHPGPYRLARDWHATRGVCAAGHLRAVAHGRHTFQSAGECAGPYRADRAL